MAPPLPRRPPSPAHSLMPSVLINPGPVSPPHGPHAGVGAPGQAGASSGYSLSEPFSHGMYALRMRCRDTIHAGFMGSFIQRHHSSPNKGFVLACYTFTFSPLFRITLCLKLWWAGLGWAGLHSAQHRIALCSLEHLSFICITPQALLHSWTHLMTGSRYPRLSSCPLLTIMKPHVFFFCVEA